MLDRTVPPNFHTDLSYQLLQPEILHTSGGVDITIVSAGEQDVTKVELIFEAGKWFEERPGLSQATTSLLNKGTKERSSLQIMNAFDQLGVHFDVTSGFDFVIVSIYGLPHNVVRILPLLAELIQRPIFPEDEIEIFKGQFIQSLKINLQKNSYVASCVSREAVFGKEHPYGRDLTVSDIEKISRDLVSAFHNSRFTLQSIILSGKILSNIREAIISTFGSFKRTLLHGLEYDITRSENRIHRENPDSVQTSIRISKKTVQRTNDDYPTMLLLNHALGGYFGSRLMTNIRERKGLTYGIYSSILSLKNASYLSIGTDVKKENMESAIYEIQLEVGRLSNEAIPFREFDTVRNHFVGSLQAELCTPFAHAEKIKTIALHKLPSNFYQDLVDRIGRFEPIDLQQCAKKHLDIASFSVVSVG